MSLSRAAPFEVLGNRPGHPYTRRLIAAVPHLTGKDRIPLEAAGKEGPIVLQVRRI